MSCSVLRVFLGSSLSSSAKESAVILQALAMLEISLVVFCNLNCCKVSVRSINSAFGKYSLARSYWATVMADLLMPTFVAALLVICFFVVLLKVLILMFGIFGFLSNAVR